MPCVLTKFILHMYGKDYVQDGANQKQWYTAVQFEKWLRQYFSLSKGKLAKKEAMAAAQAKASTPRKRKWHKEGSSDEKESKKMKATSSYPPDETVDDFASEDMFGDDQ
jgi:hypothetical protein